MRDRAISLGLQLISIFSFLQINSLNLYGMSERSCKAALEAVDRIRSRQDADDILFSFDQRLTSEERLRVLRKIEDRLKVGSVIDLQRMSIEGASSSNDLNIQKQAVSKERANELKIAADLKSGIEGILSFLEAGKVAEAIESILRFNQKSSVSPNLIYFTEQDLQELIATNMRLRGALLKFSRATRDANLVHRIDDIFTYIGIMQVQAYRFLFKGKFSFVTDPEIMEGELAAYLFKKSMELNVELEDFIAQGNIDQIHSTFEQMVAVMSFPSLIRNMVMQNPESNVVEEMYSSWIDAYQTVRLLNSSSIEFSHRFAVENFTEFLVEFQTDAHSQSDGNEFAQAIFRNLTRSIQHVKETDSFLTIVNLDLEWSRTAKLAISAMHPIGRSISIAELSRLEEIGDSEMLSEYRRSILLWYKSRFSGR